jgi:hypothetical protein
MAAVAVAECGVGANMPDPLDDPPASQGSHRKSGEVAAEHQASQAGPEVLDRHPQGDEGSEEAVGELYQAGGDDEGADLCAHRGDGAHIRPPMKDASSRDHEM